MTVFETKHIATCLEFIRDHVQTAGEHTTSLRVNATGGGAHKFAVGTRAA